MRIFNWIKDYFWAIQAYLRGKVFYQRSYQPLNDYLFRIPSAKANSRRMAILFRWWKLRPVTPAELALLVCKEMPNISDKTRHLPYIIWDKNTYGAWPGDNQSLAIAQK